LIQEDDMKNPKEIYPALLQAHEGLSAAQSADLNARLIVMLCQRLGSAEELQTMLAQLRQGMAGGQ
jgi:hypothetical protein